MDLGETWVEAKTGAGISYFYHGQTRKTTWTKPEGAKTRIVTQQQFEQMAPIYNQGRFLWANFPVKKCQICICMFFIICYKIHFKCVLIRSLLLSASFYILFIIIMRLFYLYLILKPPILFSNLCSNINGGWC